MRAGGGAGGGQIAAEAALRRARRRGWQLAVLVLLAGLALTALAIQWLGEQRRAEAQLRFDRSMQRIEAELERRLDQASHVLHGVRGMVSANHAGADELTLGTFRAYVAARNVDHDMTGVQGLGFVQRVPRSKQAAFEAAMRAQPGASAFAVHAGQGADDLFVVRYIEPLSRNAAAWGLDLAQGPVRREALERAVSSGEDTLSGQLTLAQDRSHLPAFLLLVPIFDGEMRQDSPEERRQALLGLAMAPLIAADLFRGLEDAGDGLLAVTLGELGPQGSGGAAVYRSANQAEALGSARMDGELAFHFGGRALLLHARTTPAFDAGMPSDVRPWVGLGGSLLALSAATAAWLSAAARRRAESLAMSMTETLSRLALVAERTANAVICTDAQLQIEWVNEGFTRITGYTLQDAMGRRPGELLALEGEDGETLEALRTAARRGEGFHLEMRNRCKNGQLIWLEKDIQPVHDAVGRLTGFIEIALDISERKQTQAKMEALARDRAALLDTIQRHAIVAVTDPQGRLTEVNEGFVQLSRYSREQLLGQDHRLLSSGVHPPAFWAEVWRTLAAGQPWRGQICNRAADGRIYWVESILAPILDGEGRLMRYLSIGHDITQAHEQAGELLRERERLTSIIEGTNAATWEYNLLSGEIRVNERWAGLIGYRLDELGPLNRQRWRQLVHAADLAASEMTANRHLQGEVPIYEAELRMRHRDGHWVWVLSRGKLLSRTPEGEPLWMAGTHLDITPRKLAEEQLHNSQQLLSRAERLAGVGGWSMDLATGRLRGSEEFWRLFAGFAQGTVGLDMLLTRFSVLDQQRLHEAVDLAMEMAEPWDMELEMLDTRGQSLWVRSVGEAEFDDGRPVRIIGTFADITARRELEAQTRRSNAVLRSVLDNLPCALSVFDADLLLIAYNQQFLDLLDFPAELFEARPVRFEDIIRFNARRGEYGDVAVVEATVNSIIERARHPEQHRFERTRPNGVTLEVRGAPMPGGGFVTTYVDVSERHRAEAELRRAENLLRGAIDTVNEAFALYDPEDRLLYFNEKYRQLYGRFSELIVQGARFEDIVRAGLERGLYAVAADHQEAWLQARLASHRRGDTNMVQATDGRYSRVIERKMADGHTVGFLVDITDLMRAKHEAEAASQAKGQFLANMSHEIRTPMNAILGMLKLLQRTGLSSRQQDYVSKTEGAARSLLALLNDILDFSKVEAGKMTLDPQPFRLEQLLRDLSVIISANVGAKPIELFYELDPGLPAVLIGDAMRLQQVLINLAGNAVKFTSVGEVRIHVGLLERCEGQALLEFSVSDTGIGIAPENQARIFSGFSQAEASTTRRFGGTGLGLAISQRLVQLMGGQLTLQSDVGQGSRFSFRLRCALPRVDEADASAPAAKPRVLMLEPQAAAREALRALGREQGWEVQAAADADESLCLLQSAEGRGEAIEWLFLAWPCDAAALATLMPALSGPSAPRLMLMGTALAREQFAQSAPALTAEAFLVKPLSPGMLSDAIRAAAPQSSSPGPDLAAAEAPTDPTTPAAGPARLQGLKLLLVEDNPNNQQVALELLADEGAQVDLAQHGSEALDRLREAPSRYDAVLMDVQMPVMDGYTATRLIRQDPRWQQLPVLAMTANAMPADREACLAAGMNAHVGKPFDLNELVQLLRPLLAQRSSKLTTPDLAGAMPLLTAPMLPAGWNPALQVEAMEQGLDLEGALQRMMGKTELFLRLAGSLQKSATQLPAQLREWQGEARVQDRLLALHSLRGLAATLGATRISALAAEGEALTKIQDPLDEVWLQHLQDEVDRGTQALLRHAREIHEAASGAAATSGEPGRDAEVAQHALRELCERLRESDMGALHSYNQWRQVLPASRRAQLVEALDRIDEALAELDFDAALHLCSPLLEAQE